jgi:sec-independent protein translocase protein TatA
MISGSIFLAVGPWQWVIIGLAVILLFGGKKIPELMKGLGSGIREFNKAKNDVTEQLREGMNDKPKTNSKTEDKSAE